MKLPFLELRAGVSTALGRLGFMPELLGDIRAFKKLGLYAGVVDVAFVLMSSHLGVRTGGLNMSLRHRNFDQSYLRLWLSPEETNNELALSQT